MMISLDFLTGKMRNCLSIIESSASTNLFIGSIRCSTTESVSCTTSEDDVQGERSAGGDLEEL